MNLLDFISGENDLEWQNLASCRDIDPSLMDIFFDMYEDDEVVAEQADNLCLSCPVADFCLQYGVETKSTGLWGGIYLKKGSVDKMRNSHKTEEVWEALEKIHG